MIAIVTSYLPPLLSITASKGENVSDYQFDTPWRFWLTLLLLFSFGFLTFKLYRSESANASPKARWALTAIRLTLVALIVFMLHGPRQQFFLTRLPSLILFVDDSRSMATLESTDTSASLSRLQVVQTLLQDQLLSDLSQQYQIELATIQDLVDDQKNDLATAVSKLQATSNDSPLGNRLVELQKLAIRKNAAAIVAFTDGITTSGPDLLSVVDEAIRIPVFVVGPQDDHIANDLSIQNLKFDATAYLGDSISFQFQAVGRGISNQTVTATLRRPDNMEVVSSKTIQLPDQEQPVPIEMTCTPTAVGTIPYQIELTSTESENNLQNNSESVEVTILDNLLEVLLIQNSPSYEFRFLRAAISRTRLASEQGLLSPIRLQSVLQEADLDISKADPTLQAIFRPDNLQDFDVIVFGDVDPTRLSQASMNQIVDFIRTTGKGILFIAGPNFTPHAFFDTPLVDLFPFHEASAVIKQDEANWMVEPTRLGQQFKPLQIVDDQDQNRTLWSSHTIPWHIQVPNLRPGVRVMAQLADQETNDPTTYPAITFHYVGRGKVLFQYFDSAYQIRAHGNQDQLTNYWLRMLRFLHQPVLLDQRSPLITISPDPPSPINPIRFSVTFPDINLAPGRKFDAQILPKQPVGTSSPTEFERRPEQTVELFRNWEDDRYTTQINRLQPGQYRFQFVDAEQNVIEKDFAVPQLDLESELTLPNTPELEKLAERTQGKRFDFNSADQLPNALPTGDRVRIGRTIDKPIWNSPWLALSFLILLSFEWIVRRSLGMY